ncbi:4996_t:CDS:2 [Paraglomus brasilianum]|uniref:4996_t:CDS:1 n=1 Tax=Paraglomus brasilianum TaxID=144538 RepID=A0A9N9CKV1_9GLOM|nr:4996_t:CDS:2 [Paraglomus brasilianum]
MDKAWSPKEDEILVSLGNREYGKRMRAIYLGHRTAKQCADRWKAIRGYIDRPFTPFECNRIRHLHQMYGPRWRRMSDDLRRSPKMIKECWLAMEEIA